MCFTISLYAQSYDIETDVGAVFDDTEAYTPFFHVNGFVHPNLPIIGNDRPDALQMMSWGLVPRWTKDAEAAKQIRAKTLNARGETIFEKPAFRDSAKRRRGLLPVDGFVEWRHDGAQKLPFLVRDHSHHMLTLGCLWEEWTDSISGEILRSFSIVTTQANELMSWVHNAKHRMPVIVPKAARAAWLEETDTEALSNIIRPLAAGILEALPLSRDMSRVKTNTQHHELIEGIGPPITEAPNE